MTSRKSNDPHQLVSKPFPVTHFNVDGAIDDINNWITADNIKPLANELKTNEQYSSLNQAFIEFQKKRTSLFQQSTNSKHHNNQQEEDSESEPEEDEEEEQ